MISRSDEHAKIVCGFFYRDVMVWYGMVWYGICVVVWYDMIWYHVMVWYAMLCCAVLCCVAMWCGVVLVWCYVLWYDVIWYDMIRHTIWYVIWCYMIWYDMISIRYDIMWDMMCCDVTWCDVTWRDVTWHDMTWYDMICCDVMWCDVMWCARLLWGSVVFISAKSKTKTLQNGVWKITLLKSQPLITRANLLKSVLSSISVAKPRILVALQSAKKLLIA